jgi:hypothetical protein
MFRRAFERIPSDWNHVSVMFGLLMTVFARHSAEL